MVANKFDLLPTGIVGNSVVMPLNRPQFRQQRQVTKEMSIQIYVPVAKDKSTISSPTLHGLASA